LDDGLINHEDAGEVSNADEQIQLDRRRLRHRLSGPTGLGSGMVRLEVAAKKAA
jgi:hypothetical protein